MDTGADWKVRMRVLVACEESQAVTIAFRERGHEAYSCDLQPCSGGHPEWHFQCDVRKLLIQNWDLVIAHPPCTRLANSGVCWLAERNLWQEMYRAAEFFRVFQDYAMLGRKVCIENPIPHKYAIAEIGKYSQIIQPWMFGHPESKATCLWLYNLPKLKPTKDVKEQWKSLPKNEAQRLHYLPPGPERAKLRSKTFPGIAAAMADQWGSYVEQQLKLAI